MYEVWTLSLTASISHNFLGTRQMLMHEKKHDCMIPIFIALRYVTPRRDVMWKIQFQTETIVIFLIP